MTWMAGRGMSWNTHQMVYAALIQKQTQLAQAPSKYLLRRPHLQPLRHVILQAKLLRVVVHVVIVRVSSTY